MARVTRANRTNRTATKKTRARAKLASSRKTTQKKATARRPAQKPARKVVRKKTPILKTIAKSAPRKEVAPKKPLSPKRRAQGPKKSPAKKPTKTPTRATTQSDRARVREALLAKRAETLALLERASDYSKKRLREDAEDIVDQATDSQAREVVHALSSAEGSMIRSIDNALGRLEDGDYGTCLSCEESIQSRRLLAVPWATLCVECQELQEQGILFTE